MPTTDSDSPPPIMRLEGVAKSFGGVQAIRGVDLVVPVGGVVALVGENGAGKSTLGKLMAGVHRPDEGQVIVDEEPVHFRSPRDALHHGVALVAQELALVPRMTVVDNVFLGFEPRAKGFLDGRQLLDRFDELQDTVGFSLDPSARVGGLRVAEQQKVEILRALARNARVIVLDEPTAALGQDESQALFEIVRRLTTTGTSFVFVSHFLEDVLALSDSIVILKDGEHVDTVVAATQSHDSLVAAMVGSSVDMSLPEKPAVDMSAPAALQVRGLEMPGAFADVSFEVRPGEIVGLAGLMGAGRTEVVRAVFGAEKAHGDVLVNGSHVRRTHPWRSMKRGIGMVPESRKDQGLVMGRSIRDNVTLASLGKYSRFGFPLKRRETDVSNRLIKELEIHALNSRATVVQLSGGNQQKVLFAKWLAFGAQVLLIDEPTRGVDVGAKAAIHRYIVQLAAQGVAIVLVSSEHEEVAGLAHRVLVMRRGRIVAELAGAEVREEVIAKIALGVEMDNDRVVDSATTAREALTHRRTS